MNPFNPESDPNIGNHRGNASTTSSQAIDELSGAGTTSLSAFATALVSSLFIAAFWFGLFLICRRTQIRWYAPRTHLPCWHKHERSPELPSGFLNWFGAFFRIPDAHVLNHSSIDGYLFLRLLRVMSATCFIGVLITWPVLLPVNAMGGGGVTQLGMLSFSNVKKPTWYYAHAVMACVYFTFVFYVVTRESLFYTNLRQAYLVSPAYLHRISSRSVLFMSVPPDYRSEKKLRQVFGDSVRRVWITSECRELSRKVNQRDKLAYRLERAETKLIRAANSALLKMAQKGGIPPDPSLDCENGALRYSHNFRRPTHRLGLFGKKVDSVRWLRDELVAAAKDVRSMQQKFIAGEAKQLSAIFVEFQSQADAQIALQTLSHHQPFHMTPRFIGIAPSEVVWSTLNLSWWQRIVRKFLIRGGIAALVVFWSIPSAIVGTISNITYLCRVIPFLSFIDDLPGPIKGVIAGLLPSVAVSLLMTLVPIICRICARRAGIPSAAHVELFTQNAHFCFQVVQVFLVTTMTSAASAATAQIIKDPLSAKDILAENLPKASNFYISYFLLQGLVASSMALVHIASALMFKFIATFLDYSPRRLYEKWATVSGLGWGNVFPVFVNMGVIALTYSCIAPLMLIFGFIGLYLVYQAYRYNFLFVYDIRIDTKGLVYARALQHLLTGVYLGEVCLIGLFAIRSAVGPIIIMVLFSVLTVLAHLSLNEALAPLLLSLPRTLETEDELIQLKQASELSVQSGESESRKESRLTTIWKWFHPSLHRDFASLRRKVRRDLVEIKYSDVQMRDAYFEPCITSQTPMLWIPRDRWGFSQQEIRQTHSSIPVTDERAHVDEKNKIVWDKYDPRLPLWQLKVLY